MCGHQSAWLTCLSHAAMLNRCCRTTTLAPVLLDITMVTLSLPDWRTRLLLRCQKVLLDHDFGSKMLPADGTSGGAALPGLGPRAKGLGIHDAQVSNKSRITYKWLFLVLCSWCAFALQENPCVSKQRHAMRTSLYNLPNLQDAAAVLIYSVAAGYAYFHQWPDSKRSGP